MSMPIYKEEQSKQKKEDETNEKITQTLTNMPSPFNIINNISFNGNTTK